jgi:hypothetical protein
LLPSNKEIVYNGTNLKFSDLPLFTTGVSMTIRLFLALLFTALILAAQTAQVPPAQRTDSAEENAKRLSKVEGQVLNQVTSELVRKANLTLRLSGNPAANAFTATTDTEGKFTIENVEPGRYTLSGERSGFVRTNYGARRAGSEGTVLELKAGQVVGSLVLKLTPQGVVAGRVQDDEGEPVSGVTIQALQYRYMNGRKRLIPAVVPVVTNDLGEYRVPNLPPGRYLLATSAQKMMSMQTGVERPATKGPEEGFIPVYHPSAAEPSGAIAVDLAPGAELRAIDMRLRKVRVFRVSGKIMNANTGDPIKSAMLMVYRREAGGMSTIPVSMYMVQGDKGIFELRNVPPGPYVMLAINANPQDMMLSMAPLDVGDKNIEDLTIALGGGLDIPLIARMDGKPAPPQDSGSSSATADPTGAKKVPDPGNVPVDLGNVRVTLVVDDNPMASIATTQLGKDQTAVLKRVNLDKYRLVVSGLPDGTYLKSGRYGGQDILSGGLDLRQGGTGSLELTIAAPAGELTGVVHNAKGDAVPGAIVTLVPKDAKGRTDLARTGAADQNGNIRVRGIAPAEYKVFAWEDIEQGAAEDEDFRKPFDAKGVKVTFNEGSKESLQLTVITRESVEEEKAKH